MTRFEEALWCALFAAILLAFAAMPAVSIWEYEVVGCVS